MSEEDTESERKETVWQCEGCLKTFHSARETNEHEMSCKTYMHLYPEKQTSSFRNQSIVKYPALRIFVKLYTILGFLFILVSTSIIAYYTLTEGFDMFFTFIGTTFIGYGFLLITVAELAKLVMDLQDNTYQSTELNLSMAESLRVIEDNIKSIAEKIKKD